MILLYRNLSCDRAISYRPIPYPNFLRSDAIRFDGAARFRSVAARYRDLAADVLVEVEDMERTGKAMRVGAHVVWDAKAVPTHLQCAGAGHLSDIGACFLYPIALFSPYVVTHVVLHLMLTLPTHCPNPPCYHFNNAGAKDHNSAHWNYQRFSYGSAAQASMPLVGFQATRGGIFKGSQ